jgi:hypothetical protein
MIDPMQKVLLPLILLWSLIHRCNSCLIPPDRVKRINAYARDDARAVIMSAGLVLASFPVACAAQPLNQRECDNPIYKKSIFNIPPRLSTFPGYFEGPWAASYKFEGAQFTDQFTMKELSSDVNVAGFRKYGVAYMPDVGANFGCDLRYIRNSDGVQEDRAFNLKSILQGATQATADEVELDLKKDPNRCTVKYHDSKGSGKQELFTNYRFQETLADGSFRVVENIRQSTVRVKIQQRASQTIVDYGLEWNLSMANPDTISGTFKIISYLMPQDNLYFTRPEKPVGIFLYNLTMAKK